MRAWRKSWGARCLGFLLASAMLAAQGLGAPRPVRASAAKAEQPLSAEQSLVFSSEQRSFPLEALNARTDADPAEAPRLTYFVESGGDVIRLEEDEVSIIGWGGATIRVLADETVRYRAAERLVSIEVIRQPRIVCNISEIAQMSAHIDVSLDGGSYSPGEIYDWSFQFRKVGTEEYRPLAQDWPSASPFFITLTGLSPDTSYDVLVAAQTVDKLSGGALPLETHYRVRTTSASGGAVSGTVAGITGAEDAAVSLQAGRTVLAVAESVREGEAFRFAGIPDGTYNLVARSGGQMRTTAVTVKQGAAEEAALRLGRARSVVLSDSPEAPDVVVDGLDEMAARDDAMGGGLDPSGANVPEFRLTAAYVNDYGQPAAWRLAEDDEVMGLCFSLTLHETVKDTLGRTISDDVVKEFSLPVTLSLPEALRGMEGFRVLREKGGVAEPLACSYDDGRNTLAFTADASSTYTLFHTDPGWTPPEEEADDAPVKGVVESKPEPTSPAPQAPAAEESAAYALPVIIGAGLLVLAALLVILRRKARYETLPAPEADVEDDEDEEEPEPEPEVVEEAPEEPEPEPEPEILPERMSPWDETSFFEGMEERKALKRRFDDGEIDETEFKELEREILLRM